MASVALHFPVMCAHPHALKDLPFARVSARAAVPPQEHGSADLRIGFMQQTQDDTQQAYERIVQSLHELPPVSVVALRFGGENSERQEYTAPMYAQWLEQLPYLSKRIAHMLDVESLLHEKVNAAVRKRWSRKAIVQRLDCVSALVLGDNVPDRVCQEHARRRERRLEQRRAYRKELQKRNAEKVELGKSIPFWLPYRNSFTDEQRALEQRYAPLFAQVRDVLERRNMTAVYQYIAKRNVSHVPLKTLVSNVERIEAWIKQ